MAASAGLPAERVLDMRGNHDVFDARRMGACDGFVNASATTEAHGAAGAAARALVLPLPPRLLVAPAAARAAATGGGGGSGRAVAATAAARHCPAAVLVGIDATPDLRLRAIT